MGALGLLGQNVASRASEARGLSEEVLSVLKAGGFVFTENPLQALVLRTVGMTHLWDVRVAPVLGAGPHWEHVVCLRDPRGFCGLMHVMGCSAETRRFTNAHIKCLHPEMASGHE